jgi:hypothetical protein
MCRSSNQLRESPITPETERWVQNIAYDHPALEDAEEALNGVRGRFAACVFASRVIDRLVSGELAPQLLVVVRMISV